MQPVVHATTLAGMNKRLAPSLGLDGIRKIIETLIETARELADDVARSLERQALAGLVVTVKFKTSEFRIISRSRRLAHPTQRAAVLLEAASGLIRREADGRSFRLLGVGVDVLAPAKC